MALYAVPKVLFYNWVPSFDTEKRGGGVSVYQNNCISDFKKRGWIIHSLSGGLAYDLLGGDPYVQQALAAAFELVNSPVTAPTESSFFINQITAGAAADKKVEDALLGFITENGPYDAIHFNNLEGLPAAVLPVLRGHFPQTRFVFSLHNYYPMCPQVYLWKNNSRNCDGKENGNACIACIPHGSRASDTASLEAISGAVFGGRAREKRSFLRKAIRKTLRTAKAHKMLTALRRRFGSNLAFEAKPPELPAYFATREQKMVNIINDSFDAVLCVSQRVKTLALAAGISPDKCKVSYIGTGFYKNPIPVHIPAEAPVLRLAYLGYANRLKGFEFLLSALEQCPDALLAKLDLLIAARGLDSAASARLSALGRKIQGMTIHNGYTHAELADLLGNVDLGIVPVVWEDSLPQVAIEFVCNGVPIVTSDLGGAREIASNPDFEFKAGDTLGFLDLIENFASDKQKLLGFWKNPPQLRSMEAHVTELTGHYGLDFAMEVQHAAE